MEHPVCVIFIVERAANLNLLLDLTSKKPHAGPIFFCCNVNRDASMTMTELAAQNPKQSYFLNLTGKKVTWGKLAHISAPSVHGIIGFSFFLLSETRSKG